MFVKRLELSNYRNYTRLEIELPARVNVFQGENAQGKTNLLEAIYYLATTRSPLAVSDRELLSWSATAEVIPYMRVEARYQRGEAEHTLEAVLALEQRDADPTAPPVLRRQLRLDGAPRRALDIVGQLNVVLFLPQDIMLVSGSPAERRHYLDVMLCQIDPLYCRSLARYNKVVTQRNALLRQIREHGASTSQLEAWDEQMAPLGAYVLARRLWATGELAGDALRIHGALSGGRERLALSYRSSLAARLTAVRVPLPADAGETAPAPARAPEQALAQALRRAYQSARAEEVARAMSLVGPHRDDLSFTLNGVDATIYGSRGQQRTVALALKLAEVALIQRQTSEMPVLLLDDVLSELDPKRGHYLLGAISPAQQVLMTTTDLGCYAPDLIATAALWRVAAGAVAPWEGQRGVGDAEVR